MVFKAISFSDHTRLFLFFRVAKIRVEGGRRSNIPVLREICRPRPGRFLGKKMHFISTTQYCNFSYYLSSRKYDFTFGELVGQRNNF